ncbi:Ras-specific guanine nucleotide-releasing factor 1 [Liparis tanakae]|uniref:Ras-specific guanine nucleotide-releasing factor 1 n=1 Tax=Liparis tanakae TaxID=230148 RepID=A0A4Z2DZZ2_9TELE|nr:Ras-specific guanine nucleotide-releasing factor 1 [Liparis tanakae]
MEEPEVDDESKAERSGQDVEHLDFKVMVEPKDVQPFTVILVPSSRQEKSAWTSDISQVRPSPCQVLRSVIAIRTSKPDVVNLWLSSHVWLFR